MIDSDDLCSCPRCRTPAALTYLGDPLCWSHWVRLCDRQSRDEAALLKKARENPKPAEPCTALLVLPKKDRQNA